MHGAFSASSNAASFRPTSSVNAIRVGAEGVSDAGQWAEFDASGSFALTDAIRLEATLVRTAGFSGGDSTSFSTGLSFAFQGYPSTYRLIMAA